MARHIGSEGYYARALFPLMDPRKACRKLRAVGGIARLMSVSLEVRALLLGIPSEDLGALVFDPCGTREPAQPTRAPEATVDASL